MTDASRRTLLKTAAWSVPVIAATAAVPLAAASGPSGIFAVALDASTISSGDRSVATVTIPTSAIPLVAGSVTLEYIRTAGTGTIVSASFPGTWGYTWPNSGTLTFSATPSVTESSAFTMTLSGPSTWSVTLQTPDGPYTTQIDVLAPA